MRVEGVAVWKVEQQTCVVRVEEADLLPHQGPEELVPQTEAQPGQGQREHAPTHADGQRADKRERHSSQTRHTHNHGQTEPGEVWVQTQLHSRA